MLRNHIDGMYNYVLIGLLTVCLIGNYILFSASKYIMENDRMALSESYSSSRGS